MKNQSYTQYLEAQNMQLALYSRKLAVINLKLLDIIDKLEQQLKKLEAIDIAKGT